MSELLIRKNLEFSQPGIRPPTEGTTWGIIKPTLKLTAPSIAPRAAAWLYTTHTARPLHIFAQVINLVNQDGRVLSMAAPSIGNGPFTMLVEANDFRARVTTQSPVSVAQNTLTVGELAIDLSQVSPWNPRPHWGRLTQSQFQTLKQNVFDALLAASQDQNFPRVFDPNNITPFNSPFARTAALAVEEIRQGFQGADWKTVLQGVANLTGLGVGLTPAGDDFLVGMLHGFWTRAAEQVEELCTAIARVAIPRTSTLSGAWLEAASQGEAGEVWHTLIDATRNDSTDSMQQALAQILRTGETSGADALSGFYFILNQEQLL